MPRIFHVTLTKEFDVTVVAENERELASALKQALPDIDRDWNPGGLWRPVHVYDTGPVRVERFRVLCRDADGRAVVVEIKRVGEIAGVEQLLRYQERLDLDTRLAPTLGMLVATRIKPQARVFAESRGIACVEVDLDDLRGHELPQTRLF